MSFCIINEMLGKSDKGDRTILRIFVPMRRKRPHWGVRRAPPLRTLETKAKYQGPGAEPRENFCICIWIWGYFLGSEDSDFGCN